VVDLKTFQNQTTKPKRLNEKLWHEMLAARLGASLLASFSPSDRRAANPPHIRFHPRPNPPTIRFKNRGCILFSAMLSSRPDNGVWMIKRKRASEFVRRPS